jgi:hypothetical protein
MTVFDNDEPIQASVEAPRIPTREGQNDEDYPVEIIEPNEQNLDTNGTNQTLEPVEAENVDDTQDQPYPYSLRPLPGRQNYSLAEFSNN